MSKPNADTLITAEEFGAFGDHFCRRGEFKDARHMYERQLECLERAYGNDSREIAPVLLNAADACRSYGRGPTADAYTQRALSILRASLAVEGSDHVVFERYAAVLTVENERVLATQMGARAREARVRGSR